MSSGQHRSERRPSAPHRAGGRGDSAEPGVTAASGTDARSRILATARRRFFALGFASYTMDDLARELGMSKKTLYQQFRGKEQILDELLLAKTAALRDGFEAILAAVDITFAERAARMLRHAHDQFSEISAVFLHDLRRFHPAAYARVEEFRARVAPGIWGRLLQLGIEAGAVRRDVDPEFVGRLLPAVMQSLLHPETLQRFSMQPHQMVEGFFNILFCGVLTPLGVAEHARTVSSN